MSEPQTSAVFVSYSSKDREFVEREIIDTLYTNGISPWYAGRHIQSGERWHAAIQEALAASPWFLVVISKTSIASNWVQGEVAWAMKNRWPSHIIPVQIEPCDVGSLHLWLPQLQIIKFTDGVDLRSRLIKRILATPQADSGLNPQVHLEDVSEIKFAVSPSSEIVKAPVFHFGGVVPPNCFIGRETELGSAEQIIEAGHNFLLVGQHRDGKTSMMKMLMHRMMNSPQRNVLPVYLNVQMWPNLTVETFLEHTILGMIGEVSRQVFKCKYTALNSWIKSNPPEELSQDVDFMSFLEIYRHVRERTYAREGQSPAPFQTDEFLQVHSDLLEIMQAKNWSRCVVFYDEANRLPRELSVEKLISHEEALAVPGRMSVYAASPGMAESFLQLRKSFVHEVKLPPFDRDDVRRLLACYYHGDMQRTDLPVSEDALSRLVDYSQGRPYLVQLIAGNAFRLANLQGVSQLRDDHIVSAYRLVTEENLA